MDLLKKGDTVGIIAPSQPVGGCKDMFDNGVKTLEEMGLKVKVGKNVFKQNFYNAGTIEERLSDIHDMYKDKEVKAILMALGGTTANNLLDCLDYSLIKQNPKMFLGISDGTTLLNAIHAETGQVTYHGPDLCFTFGLPMSYTIKKNIEDTLFENDTKEIILKPLSQEEFKYSLHLEKEYDGWNVLRNGVSEGKLIGGHIDCLMGPLWSGQLKLEDFDNKILFLEGTTPCGKLDRSFQNLKSYGVFDKIKGLIIGHFEWSKESEESWNRDIKDIAMQYVAEYDYPVLQIGELGHCVKNYAFPIGVVAKINTEQEQITILK
ncbi:MAG: LD-carboxypeptidase [Proteobacteria bacterium]|nr:LD-carboxypeptidase [Pseudomonadota bacterium]